MREIILASGSPRRKELLEQIGIPFQIQVSSCEERITKKEPEEIVKELSAQKAEAVAKTVDAGMILGADTIVWLDGKVMGKPRDREDARKMLTALQGKAHSVFTGVTLIQKGCYETDERETEEAGQNILGERNGEADRRERVFSFAVETRVFVHQMSREEIEGYLDTKDPFDKAGSYGIQGPFAAYVDGIEGDYNNVVGLPVARVYQELKKIMGAGFSQ